MASPNPRDTASGTRAPPKDRPDHSKRPSLKSFDSTDRVFPIRSVVSIDPVAADQSPSSGQTSDVASPPRRGARKYSIVNAQTWHELQSQPQQQHGEENISQATDSSAHGTPAAPDEPSVNPSPPFGGSVSQPSSARQSPPGELDGHVTARLQHVMADGGHAVTTGNNGSSYQYCEDEPIRIPGAVQSFGAMIALREEAPNRLVVRVASENSKQLLGYSPNQLFKLGSFSDLLDEDQADIFFEHVDLARETGYDLSAEGPVVFTLSFPGPSGKANRFWCGAHVNQTNHDLIICEFEMEKDHLNPLNNEGGETPPQPTDTLGVSPTPEQIASSTTNLSQPLRILRNTRRRTGEAAAMEVFSILTQVQEQLGRAGDLDTLLNTTTGLVKALTGFDRVMIYQFDSMWNGMVVAELVDPKITVDLYKGLHFPASDIPAQARELYKINKVRMLYDRDQTTARLVCRTLEDLETPIDMTHAYLRAMSPVHLKYLSHMQVRSSMSISINAFNDLWGLISCHSYGNTGMRVPFPVRRMCRLLGDTLSRNIERLSYASRLQSRKLINTVPTEANPTGYIIASSDDLLQLFDADYGALSIRGETKIMGRDNHPQELLALLEFIRMRRINSVLASHNITQDFPDLRYPPGLKVISGLLYVPLSTSGADFIVFFRRGQLTEIKWAGNPYDIAKRKETEGYLEPRQSFAAWRETVLSQSREWSESDLETAAVLCLVYGKFIQVWRQKEAAMQNSQLSRLLLANSAHEVRTPLNAVINYLEIALEGALDGETRENLTKSHSASKSLVYVINDLLDLTNMEKGHQLIKDEPFDLRATFLEATDMLAGVAKRKKISYTVSSRPGLPPAVLGDQRRVRQVVSNLVSNAIQHTTSGAVTVEMWRSTSQAVEGHVAVEMLVVDTGAGMSNATLERLFYELEQVSIEDRHQPDEEETSTPRRNDEERVLGLGLASVARIVHNMHGQLGVKSDESQGSRFKILLQFPLPPGASASTPDEGFIEPQMPLGSGKEFKLVGGSHEPAVDSRRTSTDSGRSGKSEADRLISDMQKPPLKRSASQESDMRRLKGPGNASSDSLPKGTPPMAHAVTADDRRENLVAASHTPPRTLQPPMSPPPPGVENVKDSGVPIGALRVPQQFVQPPPEQPKLARDQSYFSSVPGKESPKPAPASPAESDLLRVLVAEDDPINGKIVQKRLAKLGHTVELTVNGEACMDAFASKSNTFDVILMDIQASSQLSPSHSMLTLTDAHRGWYDRHQDDPRPRGKDRTGLGLRQSQAELADPDLCCIGDTLGTG